MKDQELLIAEYRMLSTANVSDGLDRIGVDGAPHGIGPLWDACGKIVGPACTLKLVDVEEADESPVLWGGRFYHSQSWLSGLCDRWCDSGH